MASDRQARLDRVHSRGYWRVLLHPAKFEEERLPSLDTCWEVMEECIVRVRGWDYPHIDHRWRRQGDGWISSGSDFLNHIEYWQFYQSGQFVHHFAMREDHPSGLGYRAPLGHEQADGAPFLDFVWTLYSCAEIFEFASRLAGKDVLTPAARVSVTLVGTEGRQLVSTNPARYLSEDYVCDSPSITFKRNVSTTDLLGQSGELALDCTLHVFESFGWRRPSRAMLAEEQRKLLEKRL